MVKYALIKGEMVMYYRIGEFSKMVGLPTSTLRYYDDIGILKPSRIDRFTDYRMYSDTDYDKAMAIKELLSLSFTLEEVLACKDNLTSDMIEYKIDELKTRINELQDQINRLESMNKTKSSNKVLQIEQRRVA